MYKYTVESDKPMVIISMEEYETMKETIEVLSDKELMRDIGDGLKAFDNGDTVSLSKVREEVYQYDGD